ncbi:MAG: hypothetical protein AB7T49_06735 [Oligoflexales bacterium]
MQSNALRITTNPKIKLPIHAFKACPTRGCSNPHLRPLGIDVYCSSCGWNSEETFIEAGGLDWWENSAVANQQPTIELSL